MLTQNWQFIFPLVLGVGVAEAQLADRFKSLDRNGDGRISREEFIGGDGFFSALDTNKDGFIDAEEAKALEARRHAKNAQAGAETSGEKRAARPSMPVPDDIEMQSDIVYKTVGSQKLALDLYKLKGKNYQKAPLVIFIHGGGHIGGSKQGCVKHNPDVFVPLIQKHGYLVASLDYRLCTPQGPKLIDCSTDCKDAVRFLVKHTAVYGIDTNRIVTLGTSAGGSLALVLPLTRNEDLPGDPELAKYPSAVKCAVSWFGCTDFSRPEMLDEFKRQKASGRVSVLFKSSLAEDKHEYEAVSPVRYMLRTAEQTPLLLVHGDCDETVPQQQSIWMHAEAKRIGFPVEFVNVKNARHGFQDAGKGPISPSLPEICKLTFDFILKNNQPDISSPSP